MNPTRSSIRVTAAAILIIALWMCTAFWVFRQAEVADQERRRSAAAIVDATLVLDQMKDAETGQRGYLLTGNDDFLDTYQGVAEAVATSQAVLASRLTPSPIQQQRLGTLRGVIADKLEMLEKAIVYRRAGDLQAAESNLAVGKGLMDSIRGEIAAIQELEAVALKQREEAYQASARLLLATIVGSGLLSVLGALAFAYGYYQRNALKLRQQMHGNTQRLLLQEEQAGAVLLQLNRSLRESEERLAVTLSSIGDAVITTDRNAVVTGLNPVGEQLTGWTRAQAIGQPIDVVFRIINKSTRLAIVIPVIEALATGTVQALANHTVLIARDGVERDIADSCAPIRDRDSQVIGAVLVFRDVSEAYIVQQRLRDGAALVQTIFDTVVDGIITIHATSGRIETVSRAAERMFGYGASELQGRDLGEVIPDFAQAAGRDAIDYFGADDAARAKGGGREVDGRRKDGSGLPLEIVASDMQLGGERFFAVIMRDVSARKQVEEALVKAGALQNAIFNSANFSSIATDAHGVIQIFNVGAERMLGYAAAEVTNRISPADISDPQEVVARAAALSQELGAAITPGFEALVFKASRGIEDIYELTYIRKDGSRFPAVVSVTALRDALENIIGYLLIGTDNTARKQVEEERTRLNQSLQANTAELIKAKAAAEKANLAKSDFLSSMSHELRSPLNAILGFAQLMESDAPPPSPTQKASIDQILHAGWYLLELINEILDLAVIESGRLSISIEPVSLTDVLLECQAMIEPQAQKRRISMTFPVFPAPVFILADHTRLKQVLINLLSNAIKYNLLGGSVVVTCTATAGRYRICVADTGLGLSPENLAQLFQPFNRLGQETSGEEGTGIGLVVSKRLVELMQGSIGVDSTVGVGSSFWITMKAGEDPLIGYVAAAEPSQSSTLKATGAPPRVLLYVEDNRANMQLMEQLISRRADMRLLTAQNGLDGIGIARQSLPDAILMDINLPGMSGIEAMQVLHRDPLTAHIPIIALSANAIPRDIEKGLESGFFRYLTKPIKVDELMETLAVAFALGGSSSSSTTGRAPAA